MKEKLIICKGDKILSTACGKCPKCIAQDKGLTLYTGSFRDVIFQNTKLARQFFSTGNNWCTMDGPLENEYMKMESSDWMRLISKYDPREYTLVKYDPEVRWFVVVKPQVQNNFEDFKFSANFKGEILKELKDHRDNTYYIGYVEDTREGITYPYSKTWLSNGECVDDNNVIDSEWALTPIKQWYNEDNIELPILLRMKKDNNKKIIVYNFNIEEGNMFDVFGNIIGKVPHQLDIWEKCV